ncbi:hypothetical protein R3P38DRAFT_721775 [Favolaschia claudopus]|uniref:Uncharacterized protein n=1 Tax=Favolaschia claudopus TaxID=2862362 RepID=A0AAV9Z4P3_9AGAR
MTSCLRILLLGQCRRRLHAASDILSKSATQVPRSGSLITSALIVDDVLAYLYRACEPFIPYSCSRGALIIVSTPISLMERASQSPCVFLRRRATDGTSLRTLAREGISCFETLYLLSSTNTSSKPSILSPA